MNSNISKELLLTKLVVVSINGTYKADTIAFLQETILQMAVSYPDLLSNVLYNYTTEMRLSFWLYFFDIMHPRNLKDIRDSLLMNQAMDEDQALILEAFEHNISKWDDYHEQ